MEMELGIQFQVQFFKKKSDSENQTPFHPVPGPVLQKEFGF
jgi:hypothetical protein